MITLKTGSAVHATQLTDEWKPQCHWIVQSGEPIEAEFVQNLLDKYGAQLKAYAVTPFGSSHCVELQFVDSGVGEQCNQEYVRGWGKGGAVATKEKSASVKSRKRLLRNRMYILPDGTEFFYYARWDGHGNLIGKTLTDVGFSPDEEGYIPLEDRIVHRSIAEEGDLVPVGNERFWVGKRPLPHTTAKQRKTVLETICALRAASSRYGPGDCYYGEDIKNIYKAVSSLTEPTIDSAILHLAGEQLLIQDDSYCWVTNQGWKTWSKWNDDYFLEIVHSESGQDWPEWESQDDWKNLKPSVWKQLEDEYQAELLELAEDGDPRPEPENR